MKAAQNTVMKEGLPALTTLHRCCDSLTPKHWELSWVYGPRSSLSVFKFCTQLQCCMQGYEHPRA